MKEKKRKKRETEKKSERERTRARESEREREGEERKREKISRLAFYANTERHLRVIDDDHHSSTSLRGDYS